MMSNIITIQNIIDQKNQIKKALKTFNCSDFEEQRFGAEEEYTCKSLYQELNALLTDITTLTKAPKQFLKLSTHDERWNIFQQLENISDYLTEPSEMISRLDELKQAIRPFDIRYTKKRLIEFDNELSDLIDKINTTSSKKEELDKVLEGMITELNKKNESITNMESQIKDQKDCIDGFASEIENYQEIIKNQETLKTEAETLIEQAKLALNLNTAAGIGQFFQQRLEKLEPQEKGFWKIMKNPGAFWWLLGAGVFVFIAVYFSYDFIGAIKDAGSNLTFSFVLARFSVVALPIAAAWFCAGQYIKIRNIAEDYAYKTVLVQSMIGFSGHLKNSNDDSDTSYQEYLRKVLDEIHQHPLKNHKKHNNNYENLPKELGKNKAA